VDKAALLASFGRHNVHTCRDRCVAHAMMADALDAMIDARPRSRRDPCAVVATTGTTSSTAVDPVPR
jgi:aromatic-L-amino-acid decarboxylase